MRRSACYAAHRILHDASEYHCSPLPCQPWQMVAAHHAERHDFVSASAVACRAQGGSGSARSCCRHESSRSCCGRPITGFTDSLHYMGTAVKSVGDTASVHRPCDLMSL